MTNILKTSMTILLVTGFVVTGASLSYAAQSGGQGGNNGSSNGGGDNGGQGMGNSGGGVSDFDPFKQKPQRMGYVIIDDDGSLNRPNDPQRPRRPRGYVEVVQGNQTCDPLYNLINRSNMMKTVPQYLECKRENGN